MSDLGVGVVNADEVTTRTDATVKDMPSGTQGTESVASENGDQASGEQSTAEGSQDTSQTDRRRGGPSKLDTIKELRSKLREQRSSFESELGTVRTQLDEMKQMMSKFRSGGEKPSKTFWEAPEEVLDERMRGHLSEFEKRMLSHLDQKTQSDQQTSEWKQEASEATKFIQGQKGVRPEDEDDIAEIVRSTPAMENLRPLDRAKYAFFLWKEMNGITDKSEIKARASSTQGMPPGDGGEKTWTEAEIERRINEFNRVPMAQWTNDQKQKFDAFELEVRNAYKAGRVKK